MIATEEELVKNRTLACSFCRCDRVLATFGAMHNKG